MLKDLRLRKSKGQLIILCVLSTIVLLGVVGVVVDASQLFVCRNRLQSIADQAALAGASKLGESVTIAQSKILEITNANGFDDSDVTITTPYTVSTDTGDPRYEVSDITFASVDLIRVQLQKTHSYTFGRLFGLTTKTMTAYSIGVTPGSPISVKGGTALGIVDQDFKYGNTYNIKSLGDEDGSNRGSLRMGGAGTSVWRDNMKYGYSGTVSIGDTIYTEPGRIAGSVTQVVNYLLEQDPTGTFEDHDDLSLRVLVVFIVSPDPTSLQGSVPVSVVGFEIFWLEGEGPGSSIIARYLGEIKVGRWGQATVIGENGSHYARLVK